jgi:hypothetical protein
MTIVSVTPFSLKNAVVQIDADDYAAAVSSVTMTPSASSVTFKGLKPSSVFTDMGAATWTLELGYAQDWSNPDSLSRYLLANEGTTKSAVITPQDGTGPSFNVTVIITPGQIGGAVDQIATATVTLGVVGSPTLVATPAIPVVTSIAPATGGTAGDTLVKITGQHFTGATDVDFGATAATSFMIDNDAVIYAISPAHAAGTVAVTVTNATGVSTTSASFLYA